MFLLLILAGVLVIVAVIGAADYQRGTTTLSIQAGDQASIQIDLNQNMQISPYLRGSNVFPQQGTSAQDPTGKGFMSYGQQIVTGLRSADIKLLRFPGGNWGEQHTPSTTQLDDFSNLLNQVGADGMMQAQLSDPTDATPVALDKRASRAGLLVDYMNNRQSIQRMNASAPFHAVKYWTIGNEPDLLTNPDTKKTYTAAEYTNAFIAYSQAMHQKDPSIRIFGPEISQYHRQGSPKDANGQAWMETFLTGIGTYEQTHALPYHLLDGVSFHWYPFDNAQQDANTLLNSPSQLDTVLPPLHQLIREHLGEDLPIALTEINTNAGKSVPAQAPAAAWWAETFGKLMNNQVAYAAFFSTEGVDTPYPLFAQKDLQPTALLRTTQLLTNLQNNLIPTQSQSGSIDISATQDSQQATVSVLVVNRTGTTQQVTVRSAGIVPFSPWKSATLKLPRYGIGILTLHRGGSDEAFSFSNDENSLQDVPDVRHLVCGSTTDGILTC